MLDGEDRLKHRSRLLEFYESPEFKDAEKKRLEFSRLPWWEQQIEAGDYHYNSWDMDINEEDL